MFEGREWYGVPGAASGTLDELREAAPGGSPASYFALLSFSDGGEGPLPVSPLNFCLDSAEVTVERLRSDGRFGRSEADDMFIFGGNGGGEYFAIDLRQNQPWPVVTIDMVAGLDSAVIVASDFDKFLEMVGLETL